MPSNPRSDIFQTGFAVLLKNGAGDLLHQEDISCSRDEHKAYDVPMQKEHSAPMELEVSEATLVCRVDFYSINARDEHRYSLSAKSPAARFSGKYD